MTPFQMKLLLSLSAGPRTETQLEAAIFPERRRGGPSFHKAHVCNGLMRLREKGLAHVIRFKHYSNPTTGGYSDDTWALTKQGKQAVGTGVKA